MMRCAAWVALVAGAAAIAPECPHGVTLLAGVNQDSQYMYASMLHANMSSGELGGWNNTLKVLGASVACGAAVIPLGTTRESVYAVPAEEYIYIYNATTGAVVSSAKMTIPYDILAVTFDSTSGLLNAVGSATTGDVFSAVTSKVALSLQSYVLE
jgi:hypothetical protein